MESLAYELLKEVKTTNKRLFIICLVEFIVIISMLIGIFIYNNSFVYEEYTQETNYSESSEIEQNIKE